MEDRDELPDPSRRRFLAASAAGAAIVAMPVEAPLGALGAAAMEVAAPAMAATSTLSPLTPVITAFVNSLLHHSLGQQQSTGYGYLQELDIIEGYIRGEPESYHHDQPYYFAERSTFYFERTSEGSSKPPLLDYPIFNVLRLQDIQPGMAGFGEAGLFYERYFQPIRELMEALGAKEEDNVREFLIPHVHAGVKRIVPAVIKELVDNIYYFKDVDNCLDQIPAALFDPKASHKLRAAAWVEKAQDYQREWVEHVDEYEKYIARFPDHPGVLAKHVKGFVDPRELKRQQAETRRRQAEEDRKWRRSYRENQQRWDAAAARQRDLQQRYPELIQLSGLYLNGDLSLPTCIVARLPEGDKIHLKPLRVYIAQLLPDTKFNFVNGAAETYITSTNPAAMQALAAHIKTPAQPVAISFATRPLLQAANTPVAIPNAD